MNIRNYIGKTLVIPATYPVKQYREFLKWPCCIIDVVSGNDTWMDPTYSLLIKLTPDNQIISIMRLNNGCIYKPVVEIETLYEKFLEQNTIGSPRPMGTFTIPSQTFEIDFVSQLYGCRFQKDGFNSSGFSKTPDGVLWTSEKGKISVRVSLTLDPDTLAITNVCTESTTPDISNKFVEAFGSTMRLSIAPIIT